MQPKIVWNVQRNRPGCYIFLLDQSNSMDDLCGGTTVPKKVVLANAVNYFLNELIAQCEKGPGLPWHYYDVALIGYTTDEQGNPEVGSVLGGNPDEEDLLRPEILSIVELFQSPLGVTEVNGDAIQYWYEPVAKHGTPMAAGLNYCRDLAQMWAGVNEDSVPPIIVHITDGEPSDPHNDPEAAARALRSVRTARGEALLFNVHLPGEPGPMTIFPSRETELPSDYARMLFRMSSELPDFCVTMARTNGFPVEPGARGMAFNTDATALITLLNVGTVPEAKTAQPNKPLR
jgi:hypothetical protein